MPDLEKTAQKLRDMKDLLDDAKYRLGIAKRAGEDVTALELSFNERKKKYVRWKTVLEEEGYVI